MELEGERKMCLPLLKGIHKILANQPNLVELMELESIPLIIF